MTDLVIRSLTVGEEHLFDTLPDPGLVGFQAFGGSYRTGLDKNEYRPEWTWVALRDDTVVARAAWWAGPDDPEPGALDWFDFTDADAAVAMLRDAPYRTEYCVRLPASWRDDPAVRAEGEKRITAAKAAGRTELVERYQYRWTPADGLPERTNRLVYRPEPDDDAFLAAFRRIAEGGLDAQARSMTAKAGLDAAARDDLDTMLWMPRGREWWRLAYTRDGELVGITLPSHNYSAPVIGFIGVVPEQRGHGYAYDLLVEATHILVEEGMTEIIAATDLTNTPMAANFAKAGYPAAKRRFDLVWPTE